MTQTVNTASTTTALASSANPSTFGASVTFTATVTAGATGTVTFYDGLTSLGSATISGNTATLSTSALTAGSHSLTAVYGGNASYATSTSSPLTQTVNSSATLPVVTGTPAAASVNAFAKATFTAAATGTPTPSVKWQKSTDGGATWSDIVAATATTYTTPATTASDNGSRYRAVFTNSAGSVATAGATLTVAYAPVINTNPVTTTVNVGSRATFTAAATGNPAATVQWQMSTTAGTTWSNVVGATSTTYTTPVAIASNNGTLYRAAFTNRVGSTTTVSATLKVNQAPSVTTQPINTLANIGSTATFRAAATGTPVPTVQWQKSTNSGSNWADVAGATSTVYTTPTLSGGDSGTLYRAVFRNGIGADVLTSNATLTVAAVAQVSGVAAGWGTQSANLLTNADGIRLLPSGRTTSIPWLNVNKLTLTLSQSITSLSAADVTFKSAAGLSYSVASISGSGTNWTVTLANSGIVSPDKLTVTIANSQLATFTRRLDVLAGDVNDDGIVNTLDVASVRNYLAGIGTNLIALVYLDVNGDGSVTSADQTLVTARNGRRLPI